MDDDKQYTITLDPEDVYPGSAAYTSTVTMPSVTDYSSNSGTFTIDTGTLDTGTDWEYNQDINVPEDADIKIGDRSLKTFMNTVEKRLAILQPDPRKLEKFEALKKAYEHYKHLESLCEIEEDDDMKGPNF